MTGRPSSSAATGHHEKPVRSAWGRYRLCRFHAYQFLVMLRGVPAGCLVFFLVLFPLSDMGWGRVCDWGCEIEAAVHRHCRFHARRKTHRLVNRVYYYRMYCTVHTLGTPPARLTGCCTDWLISSQLFTADRCKVFSSKLRITENDLYAERNLEEDTVCLDFPSVPCTCICTYRGGGGPG